MTVDAARLVALFERLDEDGRRELLELAERLAERGTTSATTPSPAARPAGETVLQAVRRLNRTYPELRRGALMGPVGELLSQHMIDGRATAEVIRELEALYARAHADRVGRA